MEATALYFAIDTKKHCGSSPSFLQSHLKHGFWDVNFQIRINDKLYFFPPLPLFFFFFRSSSKLNRQITNTVFAPCTTSSSTFPKNWHYSSTFLKLFSHSLYLAFLSMRKTWSEEEEETDNFIKISAMTATALPESLRNNGWKEGCFCEIIQKKNFFFPTEKNIYIHIVKLPYWVISYKNSGWKK